MPGFGLAPFGGPSSIFGYGSIDQEDPRTTVTIVARTIDPTTHDYVIDGRSFEATTPARQQLVIALASEFQSGAAVPELGLIWKGEVMNAGFDARAKDKIRRAARHLTDVKKNIKLTEIVVSKVPPFRGYFIVSFIDLTADTNKPQVLKIPFRFA